MKVHFELDVKACTYSGQADSVPPKEGCNRLGDLQWRDCKPLLYYNLP